MKVFCVFIQVEDSIAFHDRSGLWVNTNGGLFILTQGCDRARGEGGGQGGWTKERMKSKKEI